MAIKISDIRYTNDSMRLPKERQQVIANYIKKNLNEIGIYASIEVE